MKYIKIASIVSIAGGMGLHGVQAMEVPSTIKSSYVVSQQEMEKVESAVEFKSILSVLIWMGESIALPKEPVKLVDESNGLIKVMKHIFTDKNKKENIGYTFHLPKLKGEEFINAIDDNQYTLSSESGKTAKMWFNDSYGITESRSMAMNEKMERRYLHYPFFPYAEMETPYTKLYDPIYPDSYTCGFINSKEIHISQETNGLVQIKVTDTLDEKTVYFDPNYTKKFPKRGHVFKYRPVEITMEIAEGIIENFKKEKLSAPDKKPEKLDTQAIMNNLCMRSIFEYMMKLEIQYGKVIDQKTMLTLNTIMQETMGDDLYSKEVNKALDGLNILMKRIEEKSADNPELFIGNLSRKLNEAIKDGGFDIDLDPLKIYKTYTEPFMSCYNRHGIALLDTPDHSFALGYTGQSPKCYYAKPGKNNLESIEDTGGTNYKLIGREMGELILNYSDRQNSFNFTYFPVRNKAFLNGEEATILSRGQAAINVAQWNIKKAEELIEESKLDRYAHCMDWKTKNGFYDIRIG